MRSPEKISVSNNTIKNMTNNIPDTEIRDDFLSETHRKIVSAVVRKSMEACPGSLGLIAVYGSAATGDVHEKSDLDLMLLAKDGRAQALAKTFILDDADIGYDLYVTGWDMLEKDAECGHAHLSRLLDSVIVYTFDSGAAARLESLRKKARDILASPARYEKASAAFDRAKIGFCGCFIGESLSRVRSSAAETIYHLLDALMIRHGVYFRKGTKRTFEELDALKLPGGIEAAVMKTVTAGSADEIRAALTELMKKAAGVIGFAREKQAPRAENLRGTYEEMYSNWRGKMREAALRNDIYSSFMNFASMQGMIDEIAEETDIGDPEFMDRFDPGDPEKNEKAFDLALEEYLNVYRGIGLTPCRYKNADEFIREYLK